MRNGVKSLYRQICFIYSVSKLFSYIMEGLKSKNARQRTECLEVMGSIIADYGIGVCLPSPGVCLKEVAKQISDRDNAVRNAALNCIVQAYFVVDEKIFKLVGHISDKEMSLLEERIKRAKRPPPKPSMGPGIQHGSPQHIKTEVMSPTQPSVANMTVVTNGRDTDEDDEEDEIPNVM